MRRTPLERRTGLRTASAPLARTKPRPRPKRAQTAQDEVTMAEALQVPFRAKRPARTQKCVTCGRRAQAWHHWLPQAAIRGYARGWAYENGVDAPTVKSTLRFLLQDERGLSPTCHDHHGLLERNHTPPESAFEFASELGPEWLARLQRLHP
jgi:hypothetical protein